MEVNFKLDGNYEKYYQLLSAHKIPNTLTIEKHDIYWTKSDLGDKTEEQIEPLCTILRCHKIVGGTQHKDKKFFGLVFKLIELALVIHIQVINFFFHLLLLID